MRWLPILLMLLSLPAGAEPRQLHGIKGEDQRLRMEAQEFPWSAMGRLNFFSGHCSATLIGPRLIATAAHCLWNRRTQKPFPVSSFTFVAGWDRGEYLRASKIAAIHPAPNWIMDGQEQIKRGVLAPRRVKATRGPDNRISEAVSTVEGFE